MRIIFAGTPEFAAQTLRALTETDHEICAVYTQPDRPSGRGRKLTPSPVKQVALEHAIPVEQPLNFKQEEDRQQLARYNADLMIVVAYGLLLPQDVLDTPSLGCINIHASLLPRWRGAAPIQRAILAGDTTTGVCIMKMEAGLDTGPVLLRAECEISDDDTTQTLHDKLAELGAKTLLECLPNITDLLANAEVQNDTETTYAKKLLKEEALIDWQHTSEQISRQIRGFNPWPVAQTIWNDTVFRIWSATVQKVSCDAVPGTIVEVSKHHIDIATGKGLLRLTHVQIPGKRAMSVTDFLNSNTLKTGEQLG